MIRRAEALPVDDFGHAVLKSVRRNQVQTSEDRAHAPMRMHGAAFAYLIPGAPAPVAPGAPACRVRRCLRLFLGCVARSEPTCQRGRDLHPDAPRLSLGCAHPSGAPAARRLDLQGHPAPQGSLLRLTVTPHPGRRGPPPLRR